MERFRLYLQTELSQRCANNTKYSLRSFAKSMDVEPSELSKILNGKRKITVRMFSHLSDRLELSPAARAGLSASTYIEGVDQEVKIEGMKPFRTLDIDLFHVISDWYHYAILELTTVRGFEPDARSIAKRLRITVSEVNAAVERLQRLEMLQIERTGPHQRWIDQSGSVTTLGSTDTHVALRKLQKQVLQLAAQALENIPVERRDQSSMTMAIDSKLLPEAKERIKKFRRELCAFLQSGKKRDHVYQMSLSLFPLTDFEKNLIKK